MKRISSNEATVCSRELTGVYHLCAWTQSYDHYTNSSRCTSWTSGVVLNASACLQLLIRCGAAEWVGVEPRQSCPFLKLESRFTLHSHSCWEPLHSQCEWCWDDWKTVEFCLSRQNQLGPWNYHFAQQAENICIQFYSLSFICSGFIMRTSF